MAQDPDRLLQRLIDATSSELRRIRANVKANRNGTLWNPNEKGDEEPLAVNMATCPTCRRDFGMSVSEQRFLLDAGKLIASIAFGARKMVAEKLLKALSEGQLEAFVGAIAEREKAGKWLPDL